MDSEAAAEILRDANISEDVIEGVRALSKGQSQLEQVSHEWERAGELKDAC